MTFPLYDSGAMSGLFLGLLFGFILEAGGLGNARKLAGQFMLTDFTVFKVMFTAIVVAGCGLWLATAMEVIKPGSYYIPTPFFWSIALGGALIGAGFSIGGYCPGTSIVGLATGRLDALVFIIGMLGGTWIFAAAFELVAPLYEGAEGPKGQTLDSLTGLPAPAILAILAALGIAGFWLGDQLEKRHGALPPDPSHDP